MGHAESMMSSEESHRLFGPRRVRRLEILLSAALERERRCELKRHKLDKFTQYLNSLVERKERYLDAVRDYFSFLVDQGIPTVFFQSSRQRFVCKFPR